MKGCLPENPIAFRRGSVNKKTANTRFFTDMSKGGNGQKPKKLRIRDFLLICPKGEWAEAQKTANTRFFTDMPKGGMGRSPKNCEYTIFYNKKRGR